MDFVLIFVIIALCAYVIYREKFGNKQKISIHDCDEQNETGPAEDPQTDYKAVYQSKWLFSYNEKDFFIKLQEFAKQHELTVFAKVRLYDLVEPREKQDKSARFKIQAKHVDFVVCSSKLVAKYVIELDDQSHDTKDRMKRDQFVDDVLTACGYKVLHMRGFDTEALENMLK